MERRARAQLSLLRAAADVLPAWAALAASTSLPYVVALVRTPEGHAFTGVLSAYDDTFTYMDWISQGASGYALMCDRFTPEPHECAFFLPLWLLLGFVSRITGASTPLVFHAGRLLAGLLLLLVARAAARLAFKSRRRVRYTVWLYAFSAGLGWLVYLVNNREAVTSGALITGAVDLFLPEATAFRSVFAQVHLTAGAALTGAAIVSIFNALVERKIVKAAWSGALVSLIAVVHPYMVVVAAAVAGAALSLWPFIAGKDERLKERFDRRLRDAFAYGSAFGLAALPGAAYLFYLNRSNIVLHELLRIMDTFSPPPWQYALGFGVVGALAAAGFVLILKKRATRGRLLFIWAAVHALLLYAPFSFQRRLVEGLQMPLCVAASVALFRLLGALRRRWPITRPKRAALLALLLIFASLTNIGFFAGHIIAKDRAARDPRRYVPDSLIAAFAWLRSAAEPDAIVMSSYMTGSLLPSMTGLRVYLGHYGNTIRSEEKGRAVQSFYSASMTEDEMRSLVNQYRVSYVIYGPFEREISSDFAAREWLAPVYSRDGIQIFRVER